MTSDGSFSLRAQLSLRESWRKKVLPGWVILLYRWWWWQREGRRGRGGAGVQSQVSEQPGRRSAQAGAIWRCAEHQPGRSNPGPEQCQGLVQDRKGEDGVCCHITHKQHACLGPYQVQGGGSWTWVWCGIYLFSALLWVLVHSAFAHSF